MIDAIALDRTADSLVSIGIKFALYLIDACQSSIDTDAKHAELAAKQALKNLAELRSHDRRTLSDDSDISEILVLENCKSVAEDLLKISIKVQGNCTGKRRIFKTFAAACSDVTQRPQVKDLTEKLQLYQQQVQLYLATQLHKSMVSLKKSNSDIQQTLNNLSSQVVQLQNDPVILRAPESHVLVDDGIDQPFILPIHFCSTPQVFQKALIMKFEQGSLPGVNQIKAGHFEVWHWNETRPVLMNEWQDLVKNVQAVKLAFVLATWHSLPKGKCIRCYKPRPSGDENNQIFTRCNSCKLAVRRITPLRYTYEPQDIGLFGPDQYRNYKTASKSHFGGSKDPPAKDQKAPSDHSLAQPMGRDQKHEHIVDLVCKRIILKREPIFNIVYRYVHCRCVIWRATPSRRSIELTLLEVGVCPRHNRINHSCRDYGAIDYDQDPYFEKFGGYNLFQHLITELYPNIDEMLGGENFMNKERREAGLQRLSEFRDEQKVQSIFLAMREYGFEINDLLDRRGFPLPLDIKEQLTCMRGQRRTNEKKLPVSDREPGNYWWQQQAAEVLCGKWSGKPHWELGLNASPTY